MKKGILLLLFSSLFLSLPVCCKKYTRGFKLAKMRLETPFCSLWETTPNLTKEALWAILDQPYSYLDKGAQCYVFQNQTHEYVIKLFRYDQKRKREERKKKVDRLFSACILAYEKAREETGLLHLHLNLTTGELPVFKAKGPIGQTVKLPLDQYRFAIQKKASPFRQALIESLRAKDEEALKRKIDSFLAILHSRVEKGIGNSDPTLSRNFGFLNDRAVEIDFGNYYPRSGSTAEMQNHIRRLRRWLKKHAPNWVDYLDQQVKQCESL